MTFFKPAMDPDYCVESVQHVNFVLNSGKDIPATIVTWVNRVGDNGAVKVIAVHNGEPVDLTWHIARILNSRVKNGGVEVRGGQVNRSCELMHRLYRTLHWDGIPKYKEMSGV